MNRFVTHRTVDSCVLDRAAIDCRSRTDVSRGRVGARVDLRVDVGEGHFAESTMNRDEGFLTDWWLRRSVVAEGERQDRSL